MSLGYYALSPNALVVAVFLPLNVWMTVVLDLSTDDKVRVMVSNKRTKNESRHASYSYEMVGNQLTITVRESGTAPVLTRNGNALGGETFKLKFVKDWAGREFLSRTCAFPAWLLEYVRGPRCHTHRPPPHSVAAPRLYKRSRMDSAVPVFDIVNTARHEPWTVPQGCLLEANAGTTMER
jgi:hypothetical protein